MFLALGVAGLILLTGTDLSVGRMVGMGMVTATIIMHNGINTGGVFGHIFDFSRYAGTVPKALLALGVCIILTTVFAMIAGFFMARFKMHPFISTMANMLIIFGLVTYATKGVSFGAIDPAIPNMFIPKIRKIPNDYSYGQSLQLLLYGSSGTRQHLVRTCMQSVETRKQQPYPVFPYSK